MSEVQTANNGTVPNLDVGKSATKRPRRNLPSLPSVAGASEMETVTYTCKVDNSPTSWEALPLYCLFSLSPDGSFPLIKVSKSKAAEIRTGKSMFVGSGRCYRVVF